MELSCYTPCSSKWDSYLITVPKARLAARGYFLLSCCVFEPDRENPDVTVAELLQNLKEGSTPITRLSAIEDEPG